MKGKKTGGRIAGVPNKKTFHIESMLEDHNFDPLLKIIETFPKLLPEQQVQACLKLMKFIYPERKAVEASVSVDPAILEALELVKDKSEDELLAIVNKQRLLK